MSGPELNGFSTRRADIGAALGRLEDALARPAGAKADWLDRVRHALTDLATAGRAQISALLAPAGPLAGAVERSPRLSTPVDRLRHELPLIQAEVDELLCSLDGSEPTEVRQRLLPILGKTVRLRQAVADVLWEAYSVDIGGPG